MRSSLLCLALFAVACSPPRARAPEGPAPDPLPRLPVGIEAVSLLGDTLRAIALDGPTRLAYETRLRDAARDVEATPHDPDALIWLGRRTAYLGRFREAIAVFARGATEFPDDARFLRHRGHRYITVRELDRAIQDLERATRLSAGRPDAMEPDGLPNARGIPTSSLLSNTWYHLGLARYLKGDVAGAASAWAAGLRAAPTTDMAVATTYWLVLAQRRAGREDEAYALLETVRPGMDIVENATYHRLLLHFAGAPMPEGDSASALDRATLGYGLGAWALLNGDTVAARTLFQQVRSGGNWPAFGYIAAEAELARLNLRGP